MGLPRAAVDFLPGLLDLSGEQRAGRAQDAANTSPWRAGAAPSVIEGVRKGFA